MVIFDTDDFHKIFPNEDSGLIKTIFDNFDPLKTSERVTDEHIWAGWNLDYGRLYVINGKIVRFGIPSQYPKDRRYQVLAQSMGRQSQDRTEAELLINMFKEYVASHTQDKLNELRSKSAL